MAMSELPGSDVSTATSPTRSRRRGPVIVAVLAGVVALVGVIIAVVATNGEPARTAPRPTTTVAAPEEPPRTDDGGGPGKIAYATSAGDVMVANSDGTEPVKIGGDAATNGEGLAPLAWRQPGSDAITYVRRDGALVVAPINGTAPTVLATDAVVPADASDRILGWDATGTFVIYLAEPTPGRVESRAISWATGDETASGGATLIAGDGSGEPINIAFGDPVNRRTRSQVVSPLDPVVYLDSVDPDTGAPYTAALVVPGGQDLLSSPFQLDDVMFSPDGRYVFAVSRSVRGVEQLVRMSLRDPTKSDLVFDNERVCAPSMSPDGRYLVFGAGPDCSQMWRLNSDGTDPTMLTSDVRGATFAAGTFSWSLDSEIVSHPLCQDVGTEVSCGGPYLDVSVADGTVTQRAVAGNVVREHRALLRSVHVGIEITGAIEYSGKMQAAEKSLAEELEVNEGEGSHIVVIDEADAARRFELDVVRATGSNFVSGVIRVVDSGFDESFSFIGQLTPYSLGYAKLNGVWTRSESVPLTSGLVEITLER